MVIKIGLIDTTKKPLNQNKMEGISFTLGFCAGGIMMWAVGRTVMNEWKKDLEKLKDFDTWKEWKNQ